MKIKEEILKLKNLDIYSFMLFVLYKIKEIPEYSTLSEMAYVLDRENLLKLCEYFGGLTITIPTVDELESLIYSLILYQYVDVDKIPYEDAVKIIGHKSSDLRIVKSNYFKIKDILKNYDISSRSNS